MKKDYLYLRIASAIELQISNEVLKVGDKLPSIRTIQSNYGVSINTAKQAYLELEQKSLIESRPQSGYYVSKLVKRKLAIPGMSAPEISGTKKNADDLIGRVYQTLNDDTLTQLSLGVPDNNMLPVAKLNKGMVQALRNLPSSGVNYEDIQGNSNLRRNVSKWAFTWGGNFTEDDVITTSGAMNAIFYSLMAVTKPGDTVAVESPAYFGILQVIQNLGLKVLELPTHPVTGIEPDALKKVLPQINACILVTNFSNPLGSCMPEAHKKEVVRMLASYNIPLIEDDIYGDLFFGNTRPKPCKAFDEEGLVIWCSSVSKTLAPGYRVGWVVPGKFKDRILRLKLLQTISTAGINQEVIANFIEHGRYENHLRNMRRTLHGNSLHFIRAIADYFPEGTKVTRPTGGFTLWTELDKNINTTELFEIALQKKISIAPGRMFTQNSQFNNCIRLSFGLQWTPLLESKLQELGKLVKQLSV